MIVIHDKRIPEDYIRALKNRLPEVTFVPFGGIPGAAYGSISCHPDMYFFQLDKKTLIHSPGIPEEVLDPLKGEDIDLIRGDSVPGSEYPGSAAYNAVGLGKFFFHNIEYSDPVVLENIKGKGIMPVNVKQGYTRCSVLKVDDGTIITSDEGIATAAVDRGMDVLMVSAGSVLLPGEEYGFLGGASGSMPDGTVVFLGDAGVHPDGFEIRDFLAKYAVEVIDIKGLPLYDAGSLIIL